MPGYAYPVGSLGAESGTPRSITTQIATADELVLIYVAAEKTLVSSALASNELGTILPVELHVYRDENDATFLLNKIRILKSGILISDLVLNAGDELKAFCPIEDAINITLEIREGID